MTRRARRLAAALLTSAGLLVAAPAGAFDTGPHFDITRDALTDEGFGLTAIQYVQVSNWLTDLFENFKYLPEFTGLPSAAAVVAADNSHFDETNKDLSDAEALSKEWERLERAVAAALRNARNSAEPELAVLTILGISLHQVQDFYSHTNWLEPAGVAGAEGPDWVRHGRGATPTWFDVPSNVRREARLYSGGNNGIARGHGTWKDPSTKAVAKDWPGRPIYTQAHMASYFATRQWVQAVRAHIGDEQLWNRVKHLARRPRGLDNDLRAAYNISASTGHWQGQGEACLPKRCDQTGPGGRAADVAVAAGAYASVMRNSQSVNLFSRFVVQVNAPNPGGASLNVQNISSQPIQQMTRFVKLEITAMSEISNLEPFGWADLYVKAKIGAQPFISGMIYGHDSFSFQPPHAPMTFLKSVRANGMFDEPLESILVRIRTGDVRSAGTNDNVYLRINDRQRFQLDKQAYDDFERGDDDTYSVPIDTALAQGLHVGDIEYLQIEKSPDGVGGGWRLSRVQVWINGRLVANEGIDQWLEDNKRTRRLAGFIPVRRKVAAMPVLLQLWDFDETGGDCYALLRGCDDHADIHPYDGRRDAATSYVPGAAPLSRPAIGGDRFGGRLGDDNRAKLMWRLSTITPLLPTAISTQTPPPLEVPRADLRIVQFTASQITIQNVGTAPAGPFAVAIDTLAAPLMIPGLDPGASVSRPLNIPVCTFVGPQIRAVVDANNQIRESDETNNMAPIAAVVC